ncbi:transglutaminase family protein [bacterium]|nr:transglutaminase family protein [bacterium]
MQRYKIIHRTYYNYTAEVILGTHSLLLRPREDYELRIESFSLKTMPEAQVLWHRDVEGNSVGILKFDTAASQLMIESEVVIEQFNESPLDFLMAEYAISFPFIYKTDDRILLDAYMVLPEEETMKAVNAWIGNFYKQGENIQTYTLLQRLAKYIYQTLSYKVREEAGVQSARETLACGTGSCRDFALLFMDTLRCLGLASRFVSGYLYAPLMSDMVGATHAWAEVYLPGAGWKGFDPTIGGIAGKDHIAVAVARLPEAVPPISGSFAGTADSTLDVGVWVSQI